MRESFLWGGWDLRLLTVTTRSGSRQSKHAASRPPGPDKTQCTALARRRVGVRTATARSASGPVFPLTRYQTGFAPSAAGRGRVVGCCRLQKSEERSTSLLVVAPRQGRAEWRRRPEEPPRHGARQGPNAALLVVRVADGLLARAVREELGPVVVQPARQRHGQRHGQRSLRVEVTAATAAEVEAEAAASSSSCCRR